MCKISIMALSELRLTGSGKTTVYEASSNEKNMLFYSGGEKREAGVSFMVDDRTTRSVLAFQLISNCLAVLLIHGTIQTQLLYTYTPTKTSPDEVKDDYYNQLQCTLDLIPRIELIIL